MSQDQAPFDAASRRAPWTLLVIALVASGACAARGTGGPVRSTSTGYPASFPAADMSGPLSAAFESVKQLQVSVTYQVHSFAEDDAPTGADLEGEDVRARAASTMPVSETRRATAVLISRSARSVLFLTAAHAVFRPDTIVEYFGAGPSPPSPAVSRERRIRSISIKSGQVNWVLGLPGPRAFDVLAWDAEQDVALIGFPIRETDGLERARAMRVPAGDPADLVLGSFVYVLGYPGGYRMVSRGVATPADDGTDGFVIDGNWNQGVSGGAILAVRGDGAGLEWVGMARAAAAVREERLVAADSAVDAHDPAMPYEGPVFLQETLRIQYGVTLSVPMTDVRRFMEDHRESLGRRGYQVPRI